MTPEGAVKQAVKKILNELGAYYFFPAMGIYGRRGVPDIVGCLRGKFFAIECKAGKGKLTALQEKELYKVDAAGGLAFPVWEGNLDYLRRALILL